MIINSSFHLNKDQIYRFQHHSILLLKSTSGSFQIDFRNYSFFRHRAIFLENGQYFRPLGKPFSATVVSLPAESVARHGDARLLFKHLVSLGYIDLTSQNQHPVSQLESGESGDDFPALDYFIQQWRLQNPFRSSTGEIRLMFDLKDLIDQHFRKHPAVSHLLFSLVNKPATVNNLLKKRLGLTAVQLLHKKIMLESQREIAFTDKSIKEITYDLGFKDPAYFNRFFKRHTDQSPGQFRETFGFDQPDSLLCDLLTLIDTHHRENRSTSYYADLLGVSIKTLSAKVKKQLGQTVGDLVRARLINSSKELLQQDLPILEIAFHLGFEEANHFSTFFKTYTGQTPTDFRMS